MTRLICARHSKREKLIGWNRRHHPFVTGSFIVCLFLLFQFKQVIKKQSYDLWTRSRRRRRSCLNLFFSTWMFTDWGVEYSTRSFARWFVFRERSTCRHLFVGFYAAKRRRRRRPEAKQIYCCFILIVILIACSTVQNWTRAMRKRQSSCWILFIVIFSYSSLFILRLLLETFTRWTFTGQEGSDDDDHSLLFFFVCLFLLSTFFVMFCFG